MERTSKVIYCQDYHHIWVSCKLIRVFIDLYKTYGYPGSTYFSFYNHINTNFKAKSLDTLDTLGDSS